MQRTLVALKSMPVTRAAGQRKACFAACDVPQPATRIDKIFPVGLRGPEQVVVRTASSASRSSVADRRSRLSTGGG